MAEGTTRPDQKAAVTATDGTLLGVLQSQGNRFYGQIGVTSLPQTVKVITSYGDPTNPSDAAAKTEVTATISDLVTIDRAEAVCTLAADNTKSCVLNVAASSSDDGSGDLDASGQPTPPVLTLEYPGLSFASGLQVTAPLPASNAMPAAVTVTSAKGGVATKAITVVNQ